jgi:hypothetical protein
MRPFAILLGVVALGVTEDAANAAGPMTVPAAPADTVHVSRPVGEREGDRASILTALQQVQPGGTVQFAPGIYMLGGSVTISVPEVTLAGSSDGTTLRGCDLADLADSEARTDRCGGLELRGARQTVRNLTFEQMSWASLQISGGRSEEGRLLPATTGGHLIEGNTFRNSDSFNVISDAAEPIVIRNNTFFNTYHAVAIQGRNVHFVDNIISAPDPRRIPYGRADIAIGIAQFSPAGPRCADNLVAGNRIEGHSDGTAIGVFGPGTTCRGNVVRNNTISVVRVALTDRERMVLGDAFGSTAVGVAVSLLNYPAMCRSIPAGVELVPMWCSPAATLGQDAVLSDNLIQGNRINGGEGFAVELLHASSNRILNNTITGIARWDRFPDGVLRHPSHYLEGNGSGILISPGSDENEIVGNTFQDVAAHAIVLQGNRNRVEIGGTADTVRDLGNDNQVSGPISHSPTIPR